MGTSNAALKLVEGAGQAPCAKAANLFEGMVKKLSGDDVLGLRHGALEKLVDGDGRELLQQLVHRTSSSFGTRGSNGSTPWPTQRLRRCGPLCP